MKPAHISVNPSFPVGPVRRRTFGSFVEHLGRCVYGGIYEPSHPSADAQGFREDVAQLTRELGVSTVRYPGGNFVSNYRWEDGVGPVDERPARIDLAWHCTEPNTVGVDEFMAWARKVGVEPMMAVNLGTRGVAEAVDLLEYCNVPGGTARSDQRIANGTRDPHRIGMWCLGNEMDGPWQTGHKTPQEYARLAAETARAMRQVQPDLELVACGSSGSGMDTFGAWELEVLKEAYQQVDYISAHEYYWESDGDLASFLASGVKMDRFIKAVVALCDAARAVGKHDKHINISFDEWNVWYMHARASSPPTGDDWPVAPRLLEDNYHVADAVVVGDLLITLLNNTDRVHAASLAQLVNVIAPIMTEPGGRAWKQTTFHPFALTSAHAAGQVLRCAVDCPEVQTAQLGLVPALGAVATWDKEAGALTVFATNRSTADALPLTVDVDACAQACGGLRLVEAVSFSNPDPYWKASALDDSSVLPAANASAHMQAGQLQVTLPPVSWTMLRLAQA